MPATTRHQGPDRQPSMNLKRVLMELGNRLVTDHRYNPGFLPEPPSTAPIVDFTNWLNQDPKARAILAELGVEWPAVEG